MTRSTVVALLGGGLLAACAATPPVPAPAVATAPATTRAGLDAEIEASLVRACYPCHSDERHDPWFARIAPSGWWTKGARETLDFSRWARVDPLTRAVEIQMVADSIRKGSMPPVDYTFVNRGARLSGPEQERISEWAARAAAGAP